MSQFSTGQVVKLRSGGPAMTVVAVNESDQLGGDTVQCSWFDTTHNLHQAVFSEQLLDVQ